MQSILRNAESVHSIPPSSVRNVEVKRILCHYAEERQVEIVGRRFTLIVCLTNPVARVQMLQVYVHHKLTVRMHTPWDCAPTEIFSNCPIGVLNTRLIMSSNDKTEGMGLLPWQQGLHSKEPHHHALLLSQETHVPNVQQGSCESIFLLPWYRNFCSKKS